MANNSWSWDSSSRLEATSSSIISDFSFSHSSNTLSFSSSWVTITSLNASFSSLTSFFKRLFSVSNSPSFFLKLIISSNSFPFSLSSLCCLRRSSFSLIKLLSSSSKSLLLSSMDNLLFFSLFKSSWSCLLSCFNSISSLILFRVSSGVSPSSSPTCFIFRSTMSWSKSWTSFSYFSFKIVTSSSSFPNSFILFCKQSKSSSSFPLCMAAFVSAKYFSDQFEIGTSLWTALFSSGKLSLNISSMYSRLKCSTCLGLSTLMISSFMTSWTCNGSRDSLLGIMIFGPFGIRFSSALISISHKSAVSRLSVSFCWSLALVFSSLATEFALSRLGTS